jgi:hypothetical protein
LAELGADAPDAEIRAYIRQKDPTVPGNYISLALRKLRGRAVHVEKGERTKVTARGKGTFNFPALEEPES